MSNTIKVGTKIGATIGFMVFLTFGVVPAFYFGSYGTLLLLSKLAGGPLEPTTLVRMLTVIGVILGITCTGFVSIVTGSIFGTTLGYIISLFEVKPVQENSYEKVRS